MAGAPARHAALSAGIVFSVWLRPEQLAANQILYARRSGAHALRIGLVDRLGTLQDAIACAARMARLSDYGMKEYPEEESWLESLLNRNKPEPAAMIREQIGEENYKVFEQVKKIKAMTGSVQARLPFEIIFK